MPIWCKPIQIEKTNTIMVNQAMEENEPDNIILVAQDEGDGQVLGFIRIQIQTDYFSKEKLGCIANIAVVKEQEGKGEASPGERAVRGAGHDVRHPHREQGEEPRAGEGD